MPDHRIIEEQRCFVAEIRTQGDLEKLFAEMQSELKQQPFTCELWQEIPREVESYQKKPYQRKGGG